MRTKFLLLFVLFGLSFQSSAQKVDVKALKGINIRNIGPAGMSGRVTAIDVVLSNTQVIYIGTASGGVWMSDNGGINWKPIFDEAPNQSIGSLVINQKNPSEIWAGTGEGNPRNSLNSGVGIFKTIDGGKTWKKMGLDKTKLIHRIIIDRDNPNIVYAGALGSAWGSNPERGVYKTTDGGLTWKKILYINDETGVADLVVDPTNPNKLIAAMWEFGRKPWTFNSGGKGSGMHITYDGGLTWKRMTEKEGLPKGDLGRMGLAIAPSKPNIVYALIEAKKNAFYKSTDGGDNWKKMATDNNIGNRPFYYFDIFVDPKNENRIYSIHSTMTKSEDGGKTFERFVGWKIHPDHHAFWVHPDNPDFMIEGNDGGLNISYDRGKNWRFIENLPVSQFYHIDHDMDIPYNVCGGMQDNGSWVGPSAVWKRGGIRNSDWQEVLFGDGFDVLMRRDNNRFGWAMYQGGQLSYFDRQTGHNQYIRPVHPEGSPLRYNWNAGLAQNPFYDCGIYYGSQYLHKSLDCGQSWEIISPDLTTNDTTKQKQDESGGLTIDNTAAENFTTILSIAPSPVDEKVIWVGTDDGNLQLTRDGGDNWTNHSSKLPGFPKGAWIPQIQVNKDNAGEALVVVNDYRRNNWEPYAYHTKDYGVTWKRIVDSNKVSGHTLSIVQDPVESGLLFLGTDHGLYFTIDGGNNWNKWTNDYPSVATIDLKIHPREHDLIVGTFGRAAWIMDNIRPFRELARTNGKVLDRAFKVFEPQDAYLADYRSVDGTRFVADAHYRGSNKSSNPMFRAWVAPPPVKKETKTDAATKDKKSKKKKDKEKEDDENEEDKDEDDKEEKADKKRDWKKGDKVKVQIFNAAGDTIRNFTNEIDTGMVRIYWGFERNGIRYPSRRDVKPDADPPRGNSVLPGRYKAVFILNGHRDSAYINVKMDPRSSMTINDLKAQDAAFDSFGQIVEKATESFDQLRQAKKTIKLVNSQMVNAPDSTKKDIKKLGAALQDSLDNLMELYMMPEGLKGIQRTSENLTSSIWQARSYISASDGAPNQMAQFSLTKVRKEATETFEKVNAFFENDWKDYQAEVEAARASLFEEVKVIRLE